MDKTQTQRLGFVIVLGMASLICYSVMRVDAMTVTSPADDYAKEINQLKKRVNDLEKNMARVDSALQNLQTLPNGSPPDTDISTKSDPKSDPPVEEPAPPVSVGGDIVFTVDSFSKIPDNLKLLAEANELKGLESADKKEIKRLEEQSRKLLDALKELDKRNDTDRGMSDAEYRRLMQENTNQRGDISKVIARIKDEMNKRKNLEKAKLREAMSKGQRILGHFGAKKYIINTKSDCSKIVATGVDLLVINPKSIQSSNGVDEYEAARVELATKKK
jgi:DNA mismatch repair ATPase MutS